MADRTQRRAAKNDRRSKRRPVHGKSIGAIVNAINKRAAKGAA